MRRFWLVGLVLSVAATALAGCGGSPLRNGGAASVVGATETDVPSMQSTAGEQPGGGQQARPAGATSEGGELILAPNTSGPSSNVR